MYTGDLRIVSEPEHLLWLLSEADFYMESSDLETYCKKMILKETDFEVLKEIQQLAEHLQNQKLQETMSQIAVLLKN
jgi:predicted class III extradiol MEMO1 family dioxygenase